MSLITFSLDTFLFITISFFKEGLTESISQLFNSIGPLLADAKQLWRKYRGGDDVGACELLLQHPPSIKKPHQPRCRVVGLLFSFVDPSFKSFGQDRAYSNLCRNWIYFFLMWVRCQADSQLPWWSPSVNDKNKVIFTLPFIFINLIGSPLSLEILIDRPVNQSLSIGLSTDGLPG